MVWRKRKRERERRGGGGGGGGEECDVVKKSSHAPFAMLCRVAKFNGVTSLLAYFPTNFGAETTKIYYIGLRGDYTKVNIVCVEHLVLEFPAL